MPNPGKSLGQDPERIEPGNIFENRLMILKVIGTISAGTKKYETGYSKSEKYYI